MIAEWTRIGDAELRRTAGMKMPTEWAKRPNCWLALKDAPVSMPESAIPELEP